MFDPCDTLSVAPETEAPDWRSALVHTIAPIGLALVAERGALALLSRAAPGVAGVAAAGARVACSATPLTRVACAAVPLAAAFAGGALGLFAAEVADGKAPDSIEPRAVLAHGGLYGVGGVALLGAAPGAWTAGAFLKETARGTVLLRSVDLAAGREMLGLDDLARELQLTMTGVAGGALVGHAIGCVGRGMSARAARIELETVSLPKRPANTNHTPSSTPASAEVAASSAEALPQAVGAGFTGPRMNAERSAPCFEAMAGTRRGAPPPPTFTPEGVVRHAAELRQLNFDKLRTDLHAHGLAAPLPNVRVTAAKAARTFVDAAKKAALLTGTARTRAAQELATLASYLTRAGELGVRVPKPDPGFVFPRGADLATMCQHSGIGPQEMQQLLIAQPHLAAGTRLEFPFAADSMEKLFVRAGLMRRGAGDYWAALPMPRAADREWVAAAIDTTRHARNRAVEQELDLIQSAYQRDLAGLQQVLDDIDRLRLGR